MSGESASFPVTAQARAVLQHPDQRTSWIILLAANLRQPITDATDRLEQLAGTAPITAARLAGSLWTPGSPTSLLTSDGDPLNDERLVERFDLNQEPPIRVIANRQRTRVAIAGHHAALDGLGVAGVLRALLGQREPRPSGSDRRGPAPAGPSGGASYGADRIAPLLARPPANCRRPLDRDQRPIAHCPARRGVCGCGGEPQLADARSLETGRALVRYRGRLGHRKHRQLRLNLAADTDIASAVRAGLQRTMGPGTDLAPAWLAPLLRPIVSWCSDSILFSNLGRLSISGLENLEFYPVARGRSAVAFGAAGTPGGAATLTVRTRDLVDSDAVGSSTTPLMSSNTITPPDSHPLGRQDPLGTTGEHVLHTGDTTRVCWQSERPSLRSCRCWSLLPGIWAAISFSTAMPPSSTSSPAMSGPRSYRS